MKTLISLKEHQRTSATNQAVTRLHGAQRVEEFAPQDLRSTGNSQTHGTFIFPSPKTTGCSKMGHQFWWPFLVAPNFDVGKEILAGQTFDTVFLKQPDFLKAVGHV